MVNYSNIFPLSTGSDNNQIIVVNTNTTLNNGGFYQTGNLTTDIEIDISNVPVNDEIAFYNTSTKNVVIFGTSTVDSANIPVNKGVCLSPSSGGGFIKNTSTNIDKRLGSYTIDWIPSQKPPLVELPYSSITNLNGVVNYLGTQGGQTSYTNPYPSKISANGIAYTGSYSGLYTGSWDKLFNKNYTSSFPSGELMLRGDPSQDVGLRIEFLEGKTITPSVIAFYANKWANPSFTGTLKGVRPDNSTVNLATNIVVSSYQQTWEIITVNTVEVYKGFIFHGADIATIFIDEFECWGTLYL